MTSEQERTDAYRLFDTPKGWLSCATRGDFWSITPPRTTRPEKPPDARSSPLSSASAKRGGGLVDGSSACWVLPFDWEQHRAPDVKAIMQSVRRRPIPRLVGDRCSGPASTNTRVHSRIGVPVCTGRQLVKLWAGYLPEGAMGRETVAVLIPCFNEAPTIGAVVRQFREQLPDAQIYVFDNNSTDQTASEAQAAGATVYREPRQGKGHVVQSMFRRIDADVYLMVDGDGTYPAGEVHRLIAPVLAGTADMVVGSRMDQASQSEFKTLNRWGNRLFLWVVRLTFHVQLGDLLSGYRAFSRKFVKGVPLFGGGFETETELTIKALQRGYVIVEVPVTLRNRPEGSHSKIRIAQDGTRILHTTLALFRDYKPLTFFGTFGLVLIAASLVPGGWLSSSLSRQGWFHGYPRRCSRSDWRWPGCSQSRSDSFCTASHDALRSWRYSWRCSGRSGENN